MERLIWVYDSPFSRSIKWLLLENDIRHEDHLLSWDELLTDELLARANPKKQVPVLLGEAGVRVDSLLIALDYLPGNWHQTLDAKLFRLADSDVEAAIIFLFRARLLSSKFGESENSALMRQAGIEAYKASVDYLLDTLLADKHSLPGCDFGAVLLLSTLLAALSLADAKLSGYRHPELAAFIRGVEENASYRRMLAECQGKPGNWVPFEFHPFLAQALEG
ncbi:glutathione S-transferase N-terminal domain-containing protein [Shewanella salipaludis]|uniref:Glutathione S-transferase n=1 Tax=Shewanella salipaludis TaxID=2723052 RepID=A0A972JKA9_9GAMM|nr:glutathione S-transferase N-terminal domain-containing protein [Shewanella salipaludis]NMH64162.1 glutathione S-transferase [Shewanella salipaludis]